jgi:hypothetical protein
MRGGGGFAGSEPMSKAVHQINFGDLTPYLTYECSEVTIDNSVQVAVDTHLVNPALDQTLGETLHDEQLHLFHRQGRLLYIIYANILLTNEKPISNCLRIQFV